MFIYTSILHYYVTFYYKFNTDHVNELLCLSLYKWENYEIKAEKNDIRQILEKKI